MARYRVILERNQTLHIYIEAKTDDQAMEIAIRAETSYQKHGAMSLGETFRKTTHYQPWILKKVDLL